MCGKYDVKIHVALSCSYIYTVCIWDCVDYAEILFDHRCVHEGGGSGVR